MKQLLQVKHEKISKLHLLFFKVASAVWHFQNEYTPHLVWTRTFTLMVLLYKSKHNADAYWEFCALLLPSSCAASRYARLVWSLQDPTNPTNYKEQHQNYLAAHFLRKGSSLCWTYICQTFIRNRLMMTHSLWLLWWVGVMQQESWHFKFRVLVNIASHSSR